MANRRVTRTGKDPDGDITRLCGAWGGTSKALAIREIGGGTHSYFVDAAGYHTSVRVITVGYKSISGRPLMVRLRTT